MLAHRQRFNPSLVRLAPGKMTASEIAKEGFNPSLVRLARQHEHRLLAQLVRFNPSLVRLAPGRKETRPMQPPPGFQSQLGSIGARAVGPHT